MTLGVLSQLRFSLPAILQVQLQRIHQLRSIYYCVKYAQPDPSSDFTTGRVTPSQAQTIHFQPTSRQGRAAPHTATQGDCPTATITLFSLADFPVRLGDLVRGLGHSSPIRDLRRDTLLTCWMYRKSRNCSVSTDS